ncbi:hypothetical protein [Ruminococcus difficilis]|jgi:hypothetical protein|uniref:Phage tail assembly protein n=1 Tax=Ruminococcus difficilis TaxID=2763069 RepID=A0A934WTF6_9FIRM|nr:hypothetical protein [Ruminococcus difficilis]MBK6089632.1 hypothetical protein [Ruminococcus difficilis]
MARVVDITDKLNFEEKPRLRIHGVEIEVNNKATDVLEITPTLKKKEDITTEDIYHLFDVLFSKEEQEKVKQLELNLEDFGTFIIEAANLISATGDDEGEPQTPTTT